MAKPSLNYIHARIVLIFLRNFCEAIEILREKIEFLFSGLGVTSWRSPSPRHALRHTVQMASRLQLVSI